MTKLSMQTGSQKREGTMGNENWIRIRDRVKNRGRTERRYTSGRRPNPATMVAGLLEKWWIPAMTLAI